MSSVKIRIENEIRQSGPARMYEKIQSPQSYIDDIEIIQADAHTDIPAVDVVVDVDVDIDIDAIVVVDVDIDVNVDVDTPHVDQP